MADTATTEARSGSYVALTNLSISRPQNKERQADMVHRGETVTLTDDEAQSLMTRHRIPVIRKAGESDSGRRITARDLFGRRTAPPVADQVESLRDSTQFVQVGDGAMAPEGNAPDPSAVDPDADNEGAKGSLRGRASRPS